jgi:hypothetical protein
MVAANPFNKLDDLLRDDNDPEQLRSGTQEEELGSNPSADEGTRPAESTGNFTRGSNSAGEDPTLHQSTLTLEATQATMDKDARAHMRKWLEFVEDGWDTLTRELLRESRRPNQKTLAFAMIANGSRSCRSSTVLRKE